MADCVERISTVFQMNQMSDKRPRDPEEQAHPDEDAVGAPEAGRDEPRLVVARVDGAREGEADHGERRTRATISSTVSRRSAEIGRSRHHQVPVAEDHRRRPRRRGAGPR